jgi:hypothetical protein
VIEPWRRATDLAEKLIRLWERGMTDSDRTLRLGFLLVITTICVVVIVLVAAVAASSIAGSRGS